MREYLTETHLHTSEVSRCGHLSAVEMVDRYLAAGYHTVFVSDHFGSGYCERLGDMPWDEVVHYFLTGYRMAKERGDEVGLTVLPSVEIQLSASRNHYLLYGNVEAFLLAHEGVYKLPPEEFYRLAKAEGVYVVQSHPYRDGACCPTPECIDGMEIYNSNPRHEDYSPRTKEFALEHGLSLSSGSDAHREEDVCHGGLITDYPIESGEDLIRALTSGEARVYYNGNKVYLISDVHGSKEFKGLIDYLDMASRDDLLIILGDLHFGFDTTEEWQEFNRWLLSLDKKIAFIDGNHDNYGSIWSYPLEEWHGGLVNRINDNIVYLRRGEIYDIGGKSVFTFGGCKSSEIWKSKGNPVYDGEEATEEEIARAKENLARHGNKVDYVLTHKYEDGKNSNVSLPLFELTSYIEENVEYIGWFFGHYHADARADEKHCQVYCELKELGKR